MTENEISAVVLDSAIKIHRALGPGLYESVYETVLAYELDRSGLHLERQVPVPVKYEGLLFAEGYRADMVVEDKVMLELKYIENILPVHRKQLLTYIRLRNLRLGLLLNFGSAVMRDGYERVVNRLSE